VPSRHSGYREPPIKYIENKKSGAKAHPTCFHDGPNFTQGDLDRSEKFFQFMNSYFAEM